MRFLSRSLCNFVALVGALLLFIFVGAPILEKYCLSAHQISNLESKGIDATDLFYMESDLSRELYHSKIRPRD